MIKWLALLRRFVGRVEIMPWFPTYVYQGYQVGIRKHEKREVKSKTLAKDWKYCFGFIFNGRRIFLDCLIVTTKKASKMILKYDWKLLSPDGKQQYKSGSDIADMNINKSFSSVLDLGHISVAGQYRLDIVLSNNSNKELLSETVDFNIHDVGRLEYGIFQAFLVILITVIVNLFMRGCGIQQP